MKKLWFLPVLLLLMAAIAGCGTFEQSNPAGEEENTTQSPGISGGDAAVTDNEMFTDRDLSGTYQNAVEVDLKSGSFTITEEGTYLFRGQLTDGCITVDVSDKNGKVQIVLDGVNIYCESGAPICVLNGDKVFLTLAEGSENYLENGETIATVGEYTLNAAVYSRSDLTINGSGSLSVTSPSGHGISCKDDLVITGGNITVTSAHQGLDANDSVRICGGNLTLTAGKDGIHSENTEDTSLGFVYISGGSLTIEAEGDGVSAGSYLQLVGGDVDILAGGGWENGDVHSSDGFGQMPGGRPGGMGWGKSGTSASADTEDSSSMKGMKATGEIRISGGTVRVDSADDAIHSDGDVVISGGSFEIATGDDGVHAETTLTVTNCAVNISESYEGFEAEQIYIQGGEMVMNCSDDGLNASGGADSSGNGGRDEKFGGIGGMGGMGANENATIDISGGSLTIYAGGDGVDSNGSMTMSGGYVYVTNPSSGDVSVLDSQNQPVITGGTYIGLGVSTMMAETFSSESTQGVIACSVNGSIPAGSQITVTGSDGNVVIDVTAEYAIQLMILSCPDIIKGETYTITAGSVSGELTAD